jgi:hypothetical protein
MLKSAVIRNTARMTAADTKFMVASNTKSFTTLLMSIVVVEAVIGSVDAERTLTIRDSQHTYQYQEVH